MIPLLYLFNVICASGQVSLGKQYAKCGGTADNFNINKAVSGVVSFVVLGFFTGVALHFPTLVFGVLYGFFLCLSMHTGFKALAIGPMALTSIISSFSLIIPLAVGIFVWNEKLSLLSWLGVFLLLVSIVLIKAKRENGISSKWLLYAFLTMASNGICSIVQKYHQIRYPKLYKTEFMIFALLTVLLTLVIISFAKHTHMSVSKSGLVAGVMNGASNYIVLLLSASINASVLFPMVSVTNIIAVWLISRVIFREKMTALGVAGLLCGIISIVLLNL